MATPLRDVASREVSELPEDATKIFRFSGAIAADVATGDELQLRGPVDLDAHGLIPLTFRSRDTGEPMTREGLTLLVVEEDGVAIPVRRLNIVSMRLLEQLKPLLASGDYLKEHVGIKAEGKPPKTRYGLFFPDRQAAIV